MGNWNGLDFFIFLIFFVNTMLGMSRGATKEIISTMCVSVALIFTIKFTVPLAKFASSSPTVQDVINSSIVQNFMTSIGAGTLTVNMLNEMTYCLSLLICFVGIFCITEAVISFTGAVDVFTFPYATLNRKIGAGLGFVRGYIFTVVLIAVLQHLFVNSPIRGSYFYNLFQGTAQKLDLFISQQTPERYKELYQDKNLYNEQELFKQLKTD